MAKKEKSNKSSGSVKKSDLKKASGGGKKLPPIV